MRQRLTLVFLVLLRLAIGWDFLFEGIEKYRSVSTGESVAIGKPWAGESGKPWTSEPYFREGTGPLAKFVRSRIGDTDDLLLARLTVSPGNDQPPRSRMPERLD